MCSSVHDSGMQEFQYLIMFLSRLTYEQVRSIEIDEKSFLTPWRKLRKGRRFSDHHAIKLNLNLDFKKSPKRAKY